MHLQPIIDNLRYLPNQFLEKNGKQEWQNFYTILLRLEKSNPEYFIQSSPKYTTPYELIKALCNEFYPPYYECRNLEADITEWEFRRIRVYHN